MKSGNGVGLKCSDNESDDDLESFESPTMVLICLDASDVSARIIPHALSISEGMHAHVKLIHVIEPAASPMQPCDPVEWVLRRHEAQAYLEGLAAAYQHTLSDTVLGVEVLEGASPEQIQKCSVKGARTVTIFCRRDDEKLWRIGQTTRQVIENTHSSIMMVPSSTVNGQVARYERVVVPLDGSPLAEKALVTAMKIARVKCIGVELLHVVLPAILTKCGPPDHETDELTQKIDQHNRRVAEAYLDRIATRYRNCGVSINKHIVRGLDVRQRLTEAASEKQNQLVVMASHGVTANRDVPTGDVAGYMLSRARVPVLMIRHLDESHLHQTFTVRRDSGARLPRVDETSVC